MTFKYKGVDVENLLYKGQEVDVLQIKGVTVWERQRSTIIVPFKNSFDSVRGMGSYVGGGTIGEALGTKVTELYVVKFNNQAKLTFAGNVRPKGATTITVRMPKVSFKPEISFAWNGRWFAGRDSPQSQFFYGLTPGSQVELEFEVTG